VNGAYLEKALTLSSEIFERMNKLLPKEIRAEKRKKKK